MFTGSEKMKDQHTVGPRTSNVGETGPRSPFGSCAYGQLTSGGSMGKIRGIKLQGMMKGAEDEARWTKEREIR